LKRAEATRFAVLGSLAYTGVLALTLVASAVWPGLFDVPWGDASHRVRDIVLGLVLGGLIAILGWALSRWLEAGRKMARMLAEALAGVPLGGALLLGLSAGVAEEVVFRGALWTLVSVWMGEAGALGVTTLLFGAAHGMFRRDLRAWSLFALVTGLGLGLLRMESGGILAPLVAHVIVDVINLPLLPRLAGFGRDGKS
jgi:membrane protease YdiL (CAAX protease family)